MKTKDRILKEALTQKQFDSIKRQVKEALKDERKKVLSEVERKERPEIIEFTKEMERVMSENDKEKGDSWKTCDIEFLVDKLEEEIEEWKEGNDYREHYALMPYNLDSHKKELVDMANVCMMIWHRLEPLLKGNPLELKKSISEAKE